MLRYRGGGLRLKIGVHQYYVLVEFSMPVPSHLTSPKSVFLTNRALES